MTNIGNRRIVVMSGTGGVGKTTLSAAWALHQAQLGRHVLVLTIDPARRLAQALDLEPSAGIAQPITLPKTQGGSLHAAMLDARMTFDYIVEQFSPNPDIARRILANPYYQKAAGALGGSQEYMAMEALLEAVQDDQWDLVVLDTPPSHNAIEFLDAPRRLLAVLERGGLGWLITPAFDAAMAGTRLFGRGGAALFRIFERLTGATVLQGMAEFVTSFADLLPGFRERAAAVRELLQGSDAAFVLVTAPRQDMHGPARRFARALEERGHRLDVVAINRCAEAIRTDASSISLQEIATLTELPTGQAQQFHQEIVAYQQRREQRWQEEQLAIGRLDEALPGIPKWRLSEAPRPPHSVQDLADLAEQFSVLEAS